MAPPVRPMPFRGWYRRRSPSCRGRPGPLSWPALAERSSRTRAMSLAAPSALAPTAHASSAAVAASRVCATMSGASAGDGCGGKPNNASHGLTACPGARAAFMAAVTPGTCSLTLVPGYSIARRRSAFLSSACDRSSRPIELLSPTGVSLTSMPSCSTPLRNSPWNSVPLSTRITCTCWPEKCQTSRANADRTTGGSFDTSTSFTR
mmetsp:Transcript_10809/g.34310  ORF Transcript_10809/g.34310 Transcript_10809/m.34310 type:complete len:206 (+) Transcript_10809:770-1387(+)